MVVTMSAGGQGRIRRVNGEKYVVAEGDYIGGVKHTMIDRWWIMEMQLEIYIMLLTNVTPINLFFNKIK